MSVAPGVAMMTAKAGISSEVDAEFRAFVANPEFSCLAGKGAVRSGGYQLGVYGTLGSRRSARALAHDLAAFAADSPDGGAGLRAFVAVFPVRAPDTEAQFERKLWQELQHVHECDTGRATWDAKASDDPEDPSFAFSFAGRAMFVVGMHPASSRITRRFRWPALVFNPHDQFDRLRDEGRFERLRAVVREREVALQGSLNPNLADFGELSEARQYSGRATEPEWRCPFHRADP